MKPPLSHNHLLRHATLGVALFFMLATLLVVSTRVGMARAPVEQQASDDEVVPGPPAAWDVEGDSAPTPGAPSAIGAEAAPTDCLGSPTRQIRYTSDGVIHLAGCGQSFTLSEVAAAPTID